MTKAGEGEKTEEPRWEGKTPGEAQTGGSQPSSYTQKIRITSAHMAELSALFTLKIDHIVTNNWQSYKYIFQTNKRKKSQYFNFVISKDISR